MMFRVGAFLSALVLSSCSDFPKDAGSTLQRVRSEHVFRVGLVEPSAPVGSDPTVLYMLRVIGSAVRASPQIVSGNGETLLVDLEEGKLELVVGKFEKKSPWTQRITMGPALSREFEGKTEFQLAPLMQNGENGWIKLVERAARDAAEKTR
jgi:hypothetical protein